MSVRAKNNQPAALDPFAIALRAAIKSRGLSLERLRAHLGRRGHDLSVAALSYWQSGRSRPERQSSRAALGALEELLEVVPGSLSGLLEEEDMFGATFGGILHPQEQAYLAELYDELQIVANEGYARVSMHESVEIGPDRTVTSRVTRELLQATRDGFDRFAVCTHHGGTDAEPHFAAATNVRLGAIARRPEHRAVGARFELVRPLRAGEAIIVEYRVDNAASDAPQMWWERLCVRRVRELLVEVHFAKDDLPLAAHTYVKIGDKEGSEPIAVVDGRLTVLTQDVGPGLFGVRWRW